jgi:hypothetical protein
MGDFLTGYVRGGRTAARTASLDSGTSARLTRDIADMNDRIDRLLLVVDAMWSMLQERGYTDEDLAARIRAIDEHDGSADGARKPRPRPCPHCESMVEPGRKTCAFCGAEVAQGSPLDSV